MADQTKTNPAVRELGVEEIRETQHPSLHDSPEVEIAERAADTTASSSPKYRKDFVLLKADYVGGDKTSIHANNRAAVRQFLINAGLRAFPDEEIAVSTKNHRDGKSITLTYTVVATPAAVAEDPRLVHTRTDGEEPFEGEAADEDEGDELDPDQDPGTPAS